MNTLCNNEIQAPAEPDAMVEPEPAVTGGFTPSRVSIESLYLGFLGFVLAGYALDGRGFAYIGYSPVFIGEMALGLGVAALWHSRGWLRLLSTPAALVLIPLAGWGVAQTLPFLQEFGTNALRDAALWGYSAFAWVVAGLLVTEPGRLVWMIRWYRRLARWLLIGLPIVGALYRFYWSSIPRWPGSGVPMIFLKEGDALVHFAGILAFWISGFGGRIGWGWLILLSADVAALGVVDRAGFLSFVAVLGLCLVLWPRSIIHWRIIGLSFAAAGVLYVTDLKVELEGAKGRQISFQQIVKNLSSMVGDIDNEGLDSTKTWRTDWWKTIVGYTVNGPYFWTGKGFGVNLADDDGFQVLADGSLRNPHNAHMTFLARAGIPGVVLWVLAQACWGASIFRAFLQCRWAGDRDWLGLFLFLGAFWSAYMINASFDVFLEGPVGGIWFWSLYGAGVAALIIRRRDPEAIRAAVPQSAIGHVAP